MANHKGSEGTVHVGTTAIAEIRSYNISETSDTVEAIVEHDFVDSGENCSRSNRERRAGEGCCE